MYNPALLPSQFNNLAVSYGILPGASGLANVNYTFAIDKIGTFGSALQYLSYGEIQGYDDTGALTNVFKPVEYTLLLSHARQANNIRFGANMKFTNTSIDGYHGNAILFDIGGLFIHPDRDFTVGAAIKNVGFVTSEFLDGGNTTLPFDIQLGTSFKPLHMPVRFSVTMHQMQQWNLMNSGEEINSFNTALDNFFRHFVIGAEIILKEEFSLLAGYNHLIRKDLKQDQGGGLSGISLGFDISIKAFDFTYAFGGYNLAGNNNTFTLAANLSEITTK